MSKELYTTDVIKDEKTTTNLTNISDKKYLDKPPDYLSDNWEIIDSKELKRLEHERIQFIKNIIEQTLQLEYANIMNNEKMGPYSIIENMNIDLKYNTIHISLKKEYSNKEIFKQITKKLSEFALFNPLKCISIFTILLLKFS